MRIRRPDLERRIRERARRRRPGLRRPPTALEAALLRAAAVVVWVAVAAWCLRDTVIYIARYAEVGPRSIGFLPLLLAPFWLGVGLALARETLRGPLASPAIAVLGALPVDDRTILEHFVRRMARTTGWLTGITGVFLLLVLHVCHRLTAVTLAGTLALLVLHGLASAGFTLLVAERLPVLTRDLVSGIVLAAAMVAIPLTLVGFLTGSDPGRLAWLALAVPAGWWALAWSHGLVLGDGVPWLCLAVPLGLAAAGPFVLRRMLRVYRVREVFYHGPLGYALLGEPTGDLGETPEEPSRVARDEALGHLRAEGLLASESTWRGSGRLNRLLERVLTIEERRTGLLVLPDDPMQGMQSAMATGLLVTACLLGVHLLDARLGLPALASLLGLVLFRRRRGPSILGYHPWPTGSGYVAFHAVFPIDHRAALSLMHKVHALQCVLILPVWAAAHAVLFLALDLGAWAGALYGLKLLACVVLLEPFVSAMRLLEATTNRRYLAPAMVVRRLALALLLLLGFAGAVLTALSGWMPALPAWAWVAGLVLLALASWGFRTLALRHFDRGTVDLTLRAR